MKSARSKLIKLILSAYLLTAVLVPCAFSYAIGNDTFDSYRELIVCGNGNCKPIEMYANGKYVGAMPELFEILSEQTGMKFEYLKSSSENAYALAESGQCDILSAVTDDEQTIKAHSLIPGPVCFSYNGVDYRIAYTQRVPEKLITAINDSIEALPEGSRTLSALKGADKLYYTRIPVWVVLLIAALAVTCIALTILYLWHNAKKKRQLQTDELTGLKSKAGLIASCDKLKKHKQISLYMLAYINLDLEKLRLIFGQTEADERMQQAADLLKNSLKAHWYAARLDDFGLAVCFPSSGNEEAGKYLKPILTQLRESLNANQGSLKCDINAGVYRIDSSSTELNKSIDTARLVASCAKERGQELLFYSPELINKAAFDYRTARDILASIDLDAFEIHALPQVNPQSMEIQSAQALVRWKHPERGLLLPGSFMPAIEDTEKIKDLDEHVFAQVCSWIHSRNEKALEPKIISCNISSASLKTPDFHERLKQYLDLYELPPSSIAVEIDSATLSGGTVIANNIAKLSSYGVLIAIDNFGSENSSLRSLAEYNVYQVKLSRELLPYSTADRESLARSLLLLNNTVDICKKLGLYVSVSGVENVREHKLAKGLGCDLAEGYYYYHPMPKGEFDKL